MSNYNIGQKCRVAISVARAHCNMPPYLRLLRSTINNAPDGFVMLAEVDESLGLAYVRSHENDFLGDVQVPIQALIF